MISQKWNKPPHIYEEFFRMASETTSSKTWGLVCCVVLFLEMMISSTISVDVVSLTVLEL